MFPFESLDERASFSHLPGSKRECDVAVAVLLAIEQHEVLNFNSLGHATQRSSAKSKSMNKCVTRC